MAIITGGTIISSVNNPNVGVRGRIYRVTGVPTDTTIGVTAANGMIAENLTTNDLYERQAGVWVRIDTL
jgi:hypothetical protein